MTDTEMSRELERWPNTGRFLAGRLRHDMSEREKQLLEESVEEVARIDQPTRLLAKGEIYNKSTVLIEGFILRTLDSGDDRYAVSFHVPGDFVDLHCFALKRLDHNIDTVGNVKVGYVPHTRLQEIMETEPHLARLLWFSTLLDAAMHREWVMKLEQLTTPKRLAHIFAEVWRRLDMVELADDNGFEIPLTQNHLAEMAGATAIHINRALRDLREQDIAHFSRGRVDIPDRARLEQYGLFEPDYLYGEGTMHLREGYA